MTSAGNKELNARIDAICNYIERHSERAEAKKAIHRVITASNQQLLRELEGKAKTFERLTGEKPSGDFEKAVPLSIIKDKLKEIE